MHRLTSDKPVSEMNMVELAHNGCHIKDGCAWFRDYETDTDARELTRKLLKQYAEGDDSFTCDDDFDDYMLDCLQYDTDTIEGLIALLYRNLWAMAELRETLKQYEDIGLTPEQLMEVDELYHRKCQEVASFKPIEGYVYNGKQLYAKEATNNENT